jgi:hypothetical protein
LNNLLALSCSILLVANGPSDRNPFYKDKTIPGSKVSCCRDSDCRPMSEWRYKNGVYQLRSGTQWLTPPQDIITHEATPDQLAHACYLRVGNMITWFCVFIPEQMV